MPKKIDFITKNKKSVTSRSGSKSMTTKKVASKAKKTASGSKHVKNKKNSTTLDKPPPKRRGRRPKKIIDNFDTHIDDLSVGISNKSRKASDTAVIARLNLDPAQLKRITASKKKNGSKNEKSKSRKMHIIEDSDDSSEGIFRNDIPGDNSCHKCLKNEKALALLKSKLEKYEKKEAMDKSNKIYSNNLNFISYRSKKKIVIKKTNIKCWWDGHNFTNLPCFLPELFHNNVYHVSGCFCSFNCALAYNLYYLKDSKIHHRKSLVYKLYREMYGLPADDIIEIKEAPPKEILEDFGGTMTIDIFRRSFIMLNKEYIIFIPPMRPINYVIEERNIDTYDDDSDKDIVLKRTKPLAKKRSVISSMNQHKSKKS